MKRALLMTLCLAAVAVPVEAQLWFFPDYAAPSAYGMPASFVAATYGRGMNDASGKLDAYGAVVGRSGLGDRFTVMAGLGMIDDVDSEWTFGGAVSADLLSGGGNAQVSIQGGIGYLGIDVGGETLSSMRFPIGVALKTRMEGPTATVTPWVMPRLNISRISFMGESESETDFGASGGFSVTLPGGFGVHTALDLLAANSNIWQLGVGVHYLIQ
jgi:hypothetical protein